MDFPRRLNNFLHGSGDWYGVFTCSDCSPALRQWSVSMPQCCLQRLHYLRFIRHGHSSFGNMDLSLKRASLYQLYLELPLCSSNSPMGIFAISFSKSAISCSAV